MNQWQISREENELGKHYFHTDTVAGEQKFHLWGIVPVLTDVAGLYLSFEDWQLLDFNIACFNLMRLLLKPGVDKLQVMQSLAHYAAWDGLSILSTLADTQIKSRLISGAYHYKSPYDGARIILDQKLASDLTYSLKPDLTLNTSNWQLSSSIPFLSSINQTSNLTSNHIGVVIEFAANNFKEQLDSLDKLKHEKNIGLIYAKGEFDLQQLLLLLISGADLVETNLLAQDAVDGTLYTKLGNIDLGQPSYERDFQAVEESCPCYTCKNFTRAYLHHLHNQTPLLSKRLQIVHNLSYASHLTDKLMQYSSQGKLREFINNYMI